MRFERLNIEKHDLDKISKLIYETELEAFKSLIGKDENDAINNIKKLIKYGNNSFGYDHIHVVSDDKGNVLGILVSFGGGEASYWNDIKVYFKILNFQDFLKLILRGLIINNILITNLDENDYYLSNIAVDTRCRSQGIGSYIIENALKLAKDAGYERVLLDVTLNNGRALKLYERFGFKVYSTNKVKNTKSMEFIIQK